MTDDYDLPSENDIDEFEGSELGEEWRIARERQERTDERVAASERLYRRRAAMVRELNAFEARITIAKRAGQNVQRMEQDWKRLFGEFDAICTLINERRAA